MEVTDTQWVNPCRTYEITLDDGTYRLAEFNFKR
jgi:hypothetical protein